MQAMQRDITVRRKTIKTGMRVTVNDPNYGIAYVVAAIQIVTFNGGPALVCYNAEGLFGSFVWTGKINGDALFPKIREVIAEHYIRSCQE